MKFPTMWCETIKASDQPVHMHSVIRATFRLLSYRLNNIGASRLKRGCTGSSEYTLVTMPHCWKSHVVSQMPLSSAVVFCKHLLADHVNPEWMQTDLGPYCLQAS